VNNELGVEDSTVYFMLAQVVEVVCLGCCNATIIKLVPTNSTLLSHHCLEYLWVSIELVINWVLAVD